MHQDKRAGYATRYLETEAHAIERREKDEREMVMENRRDREAREREREREEDGAGEKTNERETLL